MALNLSNVQAALISKLKNDATLTTALGGDSEIREDMWPGPDWTYPCIRAAINLATPPSTGGCHLKQWMVTFSILVFTEPTVSGATYDASSLQCTNLMSNVKSALFGEKIESVGNFVAMTTVNITGENAPVPEMPAGGWRGEVLCEMSLLEV